jgi:nitrogen regulatory protein PII
MQSQERRMAQTYELVVAIIKRGMGEKAVAVAVQAGAKGSTIITGRGSGTASVVELYGLAMEYEKDMVLIAAPEEIIDTVVNNINNIIHVEVPGNGIILVLPIKRGLGLNKLIPELNLPDTK